MMMSPSSACIGLVKDSEGCKLTAYPDPATGGAPYTVGWGHTFGVKPGMTITQEQADQWLVEDLENAAAVVRAWVKMPLSQHQFDALCDFVFNVGAGMVGHRDGFVWLKSGAHSTMLRLLNAGAYALAADEFPKWDLPPLPGIVMRRHAERELFIGGAFAEAKLQG